MKAIGYLRVSTQGQVDEGVSLAAQEAKLRAWAELSSAAEVRLFRDEGISGKRADNRPGLQAALAVVGKGDALVVYSLSRLSRSTRDLLELAEMVRERGADLVSLTEKIDTSGAAGKMIFRVLAVLCEFERDLVSDRTKAALRFKWTQGEKTGGDVPFGFRARDGRLIVDAGEQTIIRAIVRQHKHGGSLRAICRRLEHDGAKRKGGSTSWHPETVRAILERESRA